MAGKASYEQPKNSIKTPCLILEPCTFKEPFISKDICRGILLGTAPKTIPSNVFKTY